MKLSKRKFPTKLFSFYYLSNYLFLEVGINPTNKNWTAYNNNNNDYDKTRSQQNLINKYFLL